jgi:hypothetical protein
MSVAVVIDSTFGTATELAYSIDFDGRQPSGRPTEWWGVLDPESQLSTTKKVERVGSSLSTRRREDRKGTLMSDDD